MYEKAVKEAQNILENHKPDPLPKGVKEQLRKIVQDAEKEKEFWGGKHEKKYGSTGIDVGFINQIIVQCLDSQGITDKNKKKL